MIAWTVKIRKKSLVCTAQVAHQSEVNQDHRDESRSSTEDIIATGK